MTQTIYNKTDFALDELVDIVYNLSDTAYNGGSPWSKELFMQDVQNQKSQYLVLYQQEIFLGFISYLTLFQDVELTHVVVHPQHQGAGIGTRLLQQLLEQIKLQKIEQVFLEVRPSNQAACFLYEKVGFVSINRRKNYYHHPLEDGIVMCLKTKEVMS